MVREAGSKRLSGIRLPGNISRPVPLAFPVAGSKMLIPVALKSPPFNTSVGMVRKAKAYCRRVVRSQLAKKKSLFFLMGPPNVPPH